MAARQDQEETLKGLPREKHPEWVSPMLATLTEKHFSREGWLFERKLDGVRCLAFRDGKRIRLLSRNQLSQNNPFPEIVDALSVQPARDFVIDGEIVAFDQGITSFPRLQQRLGVKDAAVSRRSRVAIFYYVFDVMHLDGRRTTGLPLRERKELLRSSLDFSPRLLRFTTHRATHGERYLEEACSKGWEGLIAKNGSAEYQGRRSNDWLKFKCVNEQELVIGGYTDPKGSRAGLGALLLGYYESGALKYAGLVGTGFSQDLLRDLKQKLSAIEMSEPPFTADGLPRAQVHGAKVHWVKPRLVAQIGFAEWTPTGKLRHPRFLGLRTDKAAKDVVRENPK
jgi:DNA ligase D-like protein (predicted ligase)